MRKPDLRYKDPDYQAKYHAKHKKARNKYSRELHFKIKYGITIAQRNEMIKVQGGRCAACGTIVKKKKLFVDHNHTTGEVRGILCMWCNFAVGHAKEDPIRLRAIADYLDRFCRYK